MVKVMLASHCGPTVADVKKRNIFLQRAKPTSEIIRTWRGKVASEYDLTIR